MKTEKEFLDDMWADIVKIEFEETQKQLAKERSLKVTRKNIFVYSAIIILFILILILIYFEQMSIIRETLYPIAIIAMLAGYIIQNMESKVTK